MPSMSDMGITNQYWGICGFTSTFYAMYGLHSDKLDNTGNVRSRVIAEIKGYLQMLKADESALLGDIETFTKTFGGYESFTIDGYIKKINESVSKSDSELKSIDFSIAMTPDAVADYIKRAWGYTATVSKSGDGDGVIGVCDDPATMPMYDGLCHYMYRKGGKIYSWGSEFSSIQAAADSLNGSPTWKLCRLISINWG